MKSVINPALLAHLVCPETRQSLVLASPEQVSLIRSRQEAGALKNRAGDKVSGQIDGALIREKGDVAYLIVDGIPDLLIAESISFESSGG